MNTVQVRAQCTESPSPKANGTFADGLRSHAVSRSPRGHVCAVRQAGGVFSVRSGSWHGECFLVATLGCCVLEMMSNRLCFEVMVCLRLGYVVENFV